jgi:hypothetical protein
MAERAARAEAEEQELFEKATQASPVRGVGDLSGLLPSSSPTQKPLLEKGETPEKSAAAPTEEVTDENAKPDADAAPDENK